MRLKLDIQKFASGSFSIGTSGALQGQVLWSSVAHQESNTSTVTVTLQARRTDSYTTTGTWTGNTVIAGETAGFAYDASISSGWVTVKTQTKTVQHGPDGTCQTQVGGGVTGPSGTSLAGNTVTGSIMVTLDPIPRHFSQKPKVETQSTTTTSGTFKWTTSENAGTVKYILDGGSETSCFSGTATTGTFTIDNLTANTSHTLKINAQRKDSGLWDYSDQISFTTSTKTVRVKVNGEWKDATPYVRVSGEWKVVVPYTRANGEWKKGK